MTTPLPRRMPRLLCSLAALLLGFTVLTSAGVFDGLGVRRPDQPASPIPPAQAAQVSQQPASGPASEAGPGNYPSPAPELPPRSIEAPATPGALAQNRKSATTRGVRT